MGVPETQKQIVSSIVRNRNVAVAVWCGASLYHRNIIPTDGQTNRCISISTIEYWACAWNWEYCIV